MSFFQKFSGKLNSDYVKLPALTCLAGGLTYSLEWTDRRRQADKANQHRSMCAVWTSLFWMQTLGLLGTGFHLYSTIRNVVPAGGGGLTSSQKMGVQAVVGVLGAILAVSSVQNVYSSHAIRSRAVIMGMTAIMCGAYLQGLNKSRFA